MGVVRIGLVLAAVVVAAIAANVALLSLAAGGKHDPVGRLSPVVTTTPVLSQPAPPPAPPQTEPPADADD